MTDEREKIQNLQAKKHAESELWRSVTKDVKPLHSKSHTTENSNKNQKNQALTPVETSIAKSKGVNKAKNFHNKNNPPQLDRRTADRLRKGQIPIEATLDLHGRSRESAYEALKGFIPQCHARGLRCVLVITGKGAKDPISPALGVLRQSLPEWLNAPPLAPYILKLQPAKPKDGGDGAFYVLLRRKKNEP